MISDPLILSIVIVLYNVCFFIIINLDWSFIILTGLWVCWYLIHNFHLLFQFDKIGDLLASSMYDSLNSWSLAALPMFILMGEILYKSSISTKLLNGLMPWLNFYSRKTSYM